MGRQIQVCTTDVDNLVFERYLKENFDCVFFQPSAPTAKELMIDSFKQTRSQILIWNKSFPWVPANKLMKFPDREYYLLENTNNAPLIEFCKTVPGRLGNGRIYWGKYFLSSNLLYNVSDFEKFYQSVTKWFIKNSAGKVKYAGINTYYMEDAWLIRNSSPT